MKQKQRIIQLSEISVEPVPESNDYRYRGRVDVLDDNQQPLIQKKLLTRLQPKWLMDIKTVGDCTFNLKLQYRRGDQSQPWQQVGTLQFDTQNVLNGDCSNELEFSLTTWELAPQLRLKVRMTQRNLEDRDLVNILAPQPQFHQFHRHQATAEAEEALELPEAIPLTPAEEVIVKDVWNKLRAQKELHVEAFFKRLLLEEPELTYIYGEAFDSIGDYFYELLDGCVHELQPHTQNIISEALTSVPAEKGGDFDTTEDYGQLFADIGMRPKHWLTARKVWMWLLPSIPYLEDYDREDLQKGTESALYKFFGTHVICPMVEAKKRYEAALSPEILQRMVDSWTVFSKNKKQMGMQFYQILFEKYPFVLPIFGRTDMDYLSGHLFQSLEFLIRCLRSGSSDQLLRELRMLGQLHGRARVPSCAYPAISDTMFALFEQYLPDFDDELREAWQTLFDRVTNVMKLPKLNEEKLLKKAKQFLDIIATEQSWEPEDRDRRWQEIQTEVQATGTYTHTYEELAYGAQLAWRNASKCIGRIQWNNMVVRDCRHVTDPDEMFRELEEHLRLGTNGGNMQSTMTVFRPKRPKELWGPRIWNPQLIRYAAYEMPDGSILGDKANLDLTKAIIQKLGWQPPEPKTAFDILPLVIEVPGQEPKLYEFQREDILEVELEHPTNPHFKSLGLRWYAIPAISNFRMDIGGVTYGCLPFNGWYMETEITRDFIEEKRYDKMGEIAQIFGLDTSSEATLWRDRVALEMNIAVVHSFQKAKVTLVDHQSASRQFLIHDQREKRAGRECPGDWAWVVPSSGGSVCPVWHHSMRDFYLEPAYHHAADRWAIEDGMDLETVIQTVDDRGDKQDRILILYASETGTAEGFARKAARQLQHFRPKVMAMDQYDITNLVSEKLLLVVTSTFGEGEMPNNGKSFLHRIQQQSPGSLLGLNYSVLGIGSTIYEHFCAAGIAVDRALARLGANPIVPLHKGDEIKGQVATFKEWLGLVSRLLGEDNTAASTLAAAMAPQLQLTFLEDEAKLPEESGVRGTPVPLLANTELLKAMVPGSRSTRYILFDLAHTNLHYETGDHVAVYPHNPQDLVQRLSNRLGLKLDAAFTASYVTAQGEVLEDKAPVAVPTTVRQVLTEQLDLSLPESLDELLNYLGELVTNPQEQHRLETWLEILQQGEEHPDSITLKKTLTDNIMSVVDLFDEFPSANLTLASLLELLPKQKPRLYSISSSPDLQPGKLQITVGVLQIKTDAGKTRQGLCSNYLANLKPSEHVRISILTSDFRPPADPQAPLLMVGPGTGISPLIAFLQHREFLQQQGTKLGEACLYFGCRNENDWLYEKQLKTWLNQGVLTDLKVAFSRTNPHAYVQKLMQKNAGSLWQLLSHPQCHYYVCGDAKMGDNVFDLMMVMAQTEGKLSRIEAVEFFNRMKQEKRFFSDVWGVGLHFQQAIGQVKKDNYSLAEKWLSQVR